MGNEKLIRKEKIPQIVLWCCYYGFAMLYATWFACYDIALVPRNVFIYFTLSHAFLLLTVMVSTLLFKRRSFDRVAKVSTVLLFILIVLSATISAVRYNIGTGIVVGILFGIVCYQVLMYFCYSLNFAERLTAIVVSNGLLCVLGLTPALVTRGNDAFYIVCATMCALTLIAQLFVKENSVLTPVSDAPEKMSSRLRLVVIIGLVGSIFSTGAVVLVTNKMVYDIGSSFLYMFYIGGFAVTPFFYIINKKKINISLNINITFAMTVGGTLASLFANQTAFYIISLLLNGGAFVMGMLCVYTGLATIVQNTGSAKFFKLMVAIVGVVGGVCAPVVAGYFVRLSGNVLEYCALASSAVILLAFMVWSPYIHKKIESEDDAPQIVIQEEKPDAPTEDVIMDNYLLSQREKEVAHLLLQGKTMRQIAAELDLSQSTVNTYCTSIYRKCNINSRTELILLFK